jgi:hypothetical protein
MSPQQTLLHFLFVRFLSPVISFISVELKYIFIIDCNFKIVQSSSVCFVTTIWTGRLRNRSSILGRGRIIPPYLMENFWGLQIPLCGRCRGPLPRVKAASPEPIHTPLSSVHVKNVWLCSSRHPHVFLSSYKFCQDCRTEMNMISRECRWEAVVNVESWFKYQIRGSAY